MATASAGAVAEGTAPRCGGPQLRPRLASLPDAAVPRPDGDSEPGADSEGIPAGRAELDFVGRAGEEEEAGPELKGGRRARRSTSVPTTVSASRYLASWPAARKLAPNSRVLCISASMEALVAASASICFGNRRNLALESESPPESETLSRATHGYHSGLPPLLSNSIKGPLSSS